MDDFTPANAFVELTFLIAALDHKISRTRQGLRQIAFGTRRLNETQIAGLYPDILRKSADIPALIEGVAPGRPEAHAPMAAVIAKYHEALRRAFGLPK